MTSTERRHLKGAKEALAAAQHELLRAVEHFSQLGKTGTVNVLLGKVEDLGDAEGLITRELLNDGR